MRIKRTLLVSASALLLASSAAHAVYATEATRTVEDIKQELVHFENREDIVVYQVKKDDKLEQIAKVLNVDVDVLKAMDKRLDGRLSMLGTFITVVEERYVIIADAFFHEVVVFDLEKPDEDAKETFSKIKPTTELKKIISKLHDHYHSHSHHDHEGHSHDGHDHDHAHDGHDHHHGHSHAGHHHGHDHSHGDHSHAGHDHSHGGHSHAGHDHSHEGHSHAGHDHSHEGHNHDDHDHSHEGHNHDHEHDHSDLKVGMEALEKMGIDPEIVHALVHADSTIPFPANETNPEKLKEYLASVKAINIGQIANPLKRKGLEYLSNVEVLGIGFTPIDDVTPILQFKKIKHLWMTATGIKNYDFLRQLKDLEGVDISQNELESIDFLREFPNLKTVAAAGNKLTNEKVEVLKALTKIEGLNLDYNELTSLEFLKEHKNLRLLSVEHNNLTSLKGVNSNQLEGIYAGHNKLSDLAPLANKEKLESVDAPNNNIKSLETLTNVPSLGQLNVNNNQLTSDTDIKRLEKEQVNVSAENNPVTKAAAMSETTETTESTQAATETTAEATPAPAELNAEETTETSMTEVSELEVPTEEEATTTQQAVNE
ncbi:hypothetical protein IU403_07250 [Aerococcaceae bacterium zg-BR22]|uniref:hypothetical protein n=1 Tax=Aerococcaceae bacterium zg-1292 TaxID=2774330 RepID=UPI0040638D84|nr:hypothetical protein [Aerococcaceae bacterium zg-BR22]